MPSGKQSKKKRYEQRAAAPPPVRSKGMGGGRGWTGRTKALLAAVAVALVAAVVLAVVLTRGGGSTDIGAAFAAAGCTLKTLPDQGQRHVASLTAKVPYNSFPPTSGPHYVEPAPWNSYPQSLSLVQEVHNLEHGGVIVQYGSRVPTATVDELNEFYASSPNGILLAPLPKLGQKIALTAWTNLGVCNSFDAKAFTAFRDAYRGNGPEAIPVSSLTPGS